MNDIPCPQCGSSLYTASHAGFDCMTCGYNEALARGVHGAPMFLRNASELKGLVAGKPPTFVKMPERLPNEQEVRAREEELKLREDFQAFKAYWASIFSSKLTTPPNALQRKALNRAYKFAEELVTRYEAGGIVLHLNAAEHVLSRALRQVIYARNAALLYKLSKKISSYLEQAKKGRREPMTSAIVSQDLSA